MKNMSSKATPAYTAYTRALHVQLPLRVSVSKVKSEDLKKLYIGHTSYLDSCGLRK